jgi:hypothetical protein
MLYRFYKVNCKIASERKKESSFWELGLEAFRPLISTS